MRQLAVALALLVALGCAPRTTESRRPAAPRPVKPVEGHDDANLLSLAAGTVVIARTGEDSLGASPLQAIDGSNNTDWSSPPPDFQQSATFVFAVPVRLDRFGFRCEPNAFITPRRIALETSTDGVGFRPLAMVTSSSLPGGQLFQLPPSETRFLRVTVAELQKKGGDQFSLESLLAYGQRLSPAPLVDVSGTWKWNERTAVLRQQGRRVEGVLSGTMPTHIVGAIDGNVVRFAWTRVNQAGYGLMTVDEQRGVLNALTWYEKPLTLFWGGSWFGTRTSRDASFQPLPLEESITIFLRVIKRFPFYGIFFDAKGNIADDESAALLGRLRDFAAAHPGYAFRINAQYFGAAAVAEDRRVTDLRAAAIKRRLTATGPLPSNLTVASAGGEVDLDPPKNEVDSLLYDRVELEVVRPLQTGR